MSCRSCREIRSTACFRTGCWIPIPATPFWIAGQSMTDLMSETDELGGLQFLEVRSTLPDELLMYADKLSMAHGLELRVPFVDKEIVEYVERLPANLKVRNGSRKWLHRQVCRSLSSGVDFEAAETRICGQRRGRLVPRRDRQQDDRDSPRRQFQNLSVSSSDAVRELFEQHSSGR